MSLMMPCPPFQLAMSTDVKLALCSLFWHFFFFSAIGLISDLFETKQQEAHFQFGLAVRSSYSIVQRQQISFHVLGYEKFSRNWSWSTKHRALCFVERHHQQVLQEPPKPSRFLQLLSILHAFPISSMIPVLHILILHRDSKHTATQEWIL